MSADPRRLRQLIYIGNGLAAVAVSACLLAVLGAGVGRLPALGRVLVPGRGAWTSAAGAEVPRGQTLTLAGLTRPVRVSFTSEGLASISARTDDDGYTALGYVEAEFRLAQMDLERRVAEGRLAQLIGRSGVASDEFELRLGLLRTAEREWAQLPKTSLAAQALTAYARGVNDYLVQARASGRWPSEFSVAGVYPRDWTPVDSLAVQGELTQELGFSTAPLDYAVLEQSLGARRTQQWFQPAAGLASAGQAAGLPAGTVRAATSILSQTRATSGALGTAPASEIGSAAASTAWAANGQKVAGGGALLAGAPDLPQTLPSTWYQVAISAPGLAVSGATVPGLPVILIGHNAHIGWSVADTPGQDTLYYDERVSRDGRRYRWRGQWRRMRVLRYEIPVRGAAARRFDVDETVQGPVLTRAGRTVAVDWTGALGSPDIPALLGVEAASNFSDFTSALADWQSPDLTFVYADDSGNIGAVTAGQDPQLSHGQPWLPLPGTGSDDVTGLTSAATGPPGYDPASHVIVAGGTAGPADSVPGYLAQHTAMTSATFATLETDSTDTLAGLVLPKLLAALRGAKLTPTQRAAEQTLASWNGQMTASSPGASVWWMFWSGYLTTVFQPWWTAARVPASLDPSGLSVSPDQLALDADLARWTVGDQRNAAFVPPRAGSARARAATPAVADMRAAFQAAATQLAAWMGPSPAQWRFGKLHTSQLPSLTRATALGYGPAPSGGDNGTVNAAVGWLNSQFGESLRVIVGWPAAGRLVAETSYPGGQSENPASPWYADQVSDWEAGAYLPMPSGTPASTTIAEELQP